MHSGRHGAVVHCQPRPRTRCSGSTSRSPTAGPHPFTKTARSPPHRRCRRPRSGWRRRCWPGEALTAGASYRLRSWPSTRIFAGSPGTAVSSDPFVTPPLFRVVRRPVHRKNSAMSNGNTTRALSVRPPAPMSQGPLIPRELPLPDPAKHELLIRVTVCGVCRTDLHVSEGDLPIQPAAGHSRPRIVGTGSCLATPIPRSALLLGAPRRGVCPPCRRVSSCSAGSPGRSPRRQRH